LIDDDSGRTVATASTIEKDLAGASGGNVAAAQNVGKAIAERAMKAGVSSVVYDRGGYLFHGRVKALIDASREAGLNKDESAAEAAKQESNND
jgi:large subunit ribosomal protein L18